MRNLLVIFSYTDITSCFINIYAYTQTKAALKLKQKTYNNLYWIQSLMVFQKKKKKRSESIVFIPKQVMYTTPSMSEVT